MVGVGIGDEVSVTPTDPLVAQQLLIEEESSRSGVVSYREKVQRLREAGMESLTKPMSHLIRVYLDPVSQGLKDWVQTFDKRVSGRRPIAWSALSACDLDVVSLLALREVLNCLSRKSTAVTVMVSIGRAIEQEMKLMAFETQHPRAYKRTQRFIEDSPQSYRPSYRKSLMMFFTRLHGLVWERWEPKLAMQVGAVVLGQIIKHTGLVEISQLPGRQSAKRMGVPKLLPGKGLTEWIEARHLECEGLRPDYPPMVCEPKPHTGPIGGGYLSSALRYPLVHMPHDAARWTQTEQDAPIVYKAVNTLQKTQWQVNRQVLAVVNHLWEIGADIPGAARRVDLELPPKPADIETNRDARREYKAAAREVYFANLANAGRRLQVAHILAVANRYRDRDKIWFPVKMDFRGRVYFRTRHFHPQASDLGRGLLRFARGERLGKRGLHWLKVYAANCYGVDKVPIEQRIQWVDANREEIINVGVDPLVHNLWREASEPIKFLSVCLELSAAWQMDDPTKFVSHIPIMVDGSCNGIQHLSALSLDAKAGAYVNLVPSDQPSDIYARVAEEVIEQCHTLRAYLTQPTSGSDSESSPSSPSPVSSGPPDLKERSLDNRKKKYQPNPQREAEFAQQWLDYGIDRSLCKRPTMILPYGGTRDAVERYVDEWITERVKAGKPHPWGADRRKATAFMARIIWEAMNRVVTGPRQMMDWTKQVARVVSQQNRPLCWTTPSGFVVRQARYQLSGKRVETRLGDRSIKLTLCKATDRIDSRKQAQALAPNWIHSLDAAALHLTIAALADKGVEDIVTIHDSYGVHAANMDILAGTLREEFVKIYREDQIARFIADVSDGEESKIPPCPPKGHLNIDDVLDSQYAFC